MSVIDSVEYALDHPDVLYGPRELRRLLRDLMDEYRRLESFNATYRLTNMELREALGRANV